MFKNVLFDFKALDSDRVCIRLQMLDPNPQKMNADPQH